MAIEVTLLNNNSTANITTNFDRVVEALQESLARNGVAPNNMEVDLDMDGNAIINIGSFSMEDGRTLQDILDEAEQAVVDAEAQVTLAAAQVVLAEAAASNSAISATQSSVFADAAANSALEMSTLIDSVEAGLIPRDYGYVIDVAGEVEDYGDIV